MGLENSFIPKSAYKIAQKSFKNFKLSIQNVVSTERDFAKKKNKKKNGYLCTSNGCIRFARYCGKI